MKLVPTAAVLAALALAVPALAQQGTDAPVATAPAAPTAGRSVAKPEFARCAGVYGALGRLQERFGSEHTLVGEVYPNLLRIDFNARLAGLARSVSKGITELKTDTEGEQAEFYTVLIDVETDADLESEKLKDLVLTSDACDLQYGGSPSLGG